MSNRVVDKPGRGVDGVANEDTLPCFGRELESLRGVNVDKGRTAEDSKIGEIWVTSSERGEGDSASSLGPRAVTEVDHGDEGESPKAIRKRG